MRRRNFLMGAGGLAGLSMTGGLPFLSSLAHAGSALRDDRYFVFCYFNGAWDILLGLDPRDPSAFRLDNVDQTLIEPAYDVVEGLPTDRLIDTARDGMRFGPAIGGMAAHADRLAVVRGMSMDTLNHPVGMRYFLTGKAPAGNLANGSSMATWMSALLGAGEPVPNLVFDLETYNTDQDQWASGLRVSSVDDLVRALKPSPFAISDAEAEQIDVLLSQFEQGGRTLRSEVLTAAAGARAGARELVALGFDSALDLAADTPEMEALRGFHGVSTSDLGSASAQAAAAVLALTTGMSRCVSVQAASGLDTHNENWSQEHGVNQQAGWDVVARLMDDLGRRQFRDTGDSWLDHTTILCFSEFSRTSRRNANGGRDHSLTNACLLAGAGIRPGVYGASSDYNMEPRAVDLATGVLDPGGEIIRPQNIFRALLKSAGVADDLPRLRADAFDAILS